MNNNLDIVKSTYEGGSSAENGRNLQAHLSDDVQWTEAAGFPYAGTYTGFDDIAANVFSRLENEWIDYRFIPERYIAEGDAVVALGSYSGTHRESGKSFSARVAHWWTVQDNRIIRFEQIVDSKTVVDAMR